MAYTEELDELWGVTVDGGRTFVDNNGNLSSIGLWSDGHDLFNSKQEAEAFLQAQANAYENMSVVKLTFTVQVTAE